MDYSQWTSQWPAMANLDFGQPGSLGGSNMFQGWDFTGTAGGAGGAGSVGAGGLPAGGGVAAPGTGGFQLGANLPTAQLAIGGLQTLGSLWGAMNAQSLAKKQFNFTRDVTNTNLDNSIQSYNTALGDRANARAKTQGDSTAERDAYIAANRLTRS